MLHAIEWDHTVDLVGGKREPFAVGQGREGGIKFGDGLCVEFHLRGVCRLLPCFRFPGFDGLCDACLHVCGFMHVCMWVCMWKYTDVLCVLLVGVDPVEKMRDKGGIFPLLCVLLTMIYGGGEKCALAFPGPLSPAVNVCTRKEA